MENGIKARIESEIDVKAYIQNLQFSLNNGAKIEFQGKRFVDEDRDERYTNQYTVNVLFPNENPVDVLRRELLKLSVSDYMRTVKDTRFPKRSEMREFGKVYNGKDEVYIKMLQHLLCHFILQRNRLHRTYSLIERIRRCFHEHESYKK